MSTARSSRFLPAIARAVKTGVLVAGRSWEHLVELVARRVSLHNLCVEALLVGGDVRLHAGRRGGDAAHVIVTVLKHVVKVGEAGLQSCSGEDVELCVSWLPITLFLRLQE